MLDIKSSYMLKKLFIICILLSLIVVMSYATYLNIFLSSRIQESKLVYIKKGSSLRGVITTLKNNNIIKDKITTELIIRFKTKNNPNIKYGEYLFEKNSTIDNILNKMVNNEVYYRSITFAEGLSTHSILKIIRENKFLVGDIPENIPEGSLLPQTYNFMKGDTRESLIKRMQNDMYKVINKYWEGRAEDLPIRTKKEALILASIVEKETGIPEERGLVASVFVNRLRINMPLQSDPTAIYGYAFGDVSKERDIKTHKLIRMDNEYNTYKIRKLPPTPICNPGEDSIKAVLNPANTKYLFFVATGDGGHDFSETYIEHIKNIKDLKNNIRK